MNETEQVTARVCESYEQPGRWYWHVVDDQLGVGSASILESGYRDTEKAAETAALSALIRWRAKETR